LAGAQIHQGLLCLPVHKTEHLHPTELLQHLDVPSSIWTDIAMDFIEGFPKMGGGSKSVMLTIVDHLSKYAHFITLGHFDVDHQ
jgi:hypothetical protein